MARGTRLALPVAALLVAAVAAGCGSSGGSGNSSATAVKVADFSFTPADTTIKVGQTVTWTNDDDIPHTVVATDKSFRSKVLDTGQSFSFTFAKPGQIAYFCSLHPMMTGKVTVAAR